MNSLAIGLLIIMYYGEHTVDIVYSGKSVIISTSKPIVRGRIADTAVQEVFVIA